MYKVFFCTVAPLLNQETLEGMEGWHRVGAQGCACGGGTIPENSCPLRMDYQRGSGAWLPEFEPRFHHLLSKWLWLNSLTSLSLRFLTYIIRIVIVPLQACEE